MERLDPLIGHDVDPLSVEGRFQLANKLVGPCSPSEIKSLQVKIECVIQMLHQRYADKESLHGKRGTFLTEAERMIASIGVVCHQVLLYRLDHLSFSEIQSFVTRPWLRHLVPVRSLRISFGTVLKRSKNEAFMILQCNS